MEKRSLEYLLRHLLLVRELEPDSEVRPWAEVVERIGRCGAQLLDDHARKYPTIFGLDTRGWGGREAGQNVKSDDLSGPARLDPLATQECVTA